MIRISLLSKPVRFIARPYRAALGAAIVAVGVLLASIGSAREGRVCVLVPHFKDEYWLSVAHGITNEADGLGLTPVFFEAGGYRAVAQQIEQIASCKKQGSAAILIGVVSSDDPDLLRALGEATKHLPVIGLVNETDATGLAGFVGVDWRDMGRVIGNYLADSHPVGASPVSAVLVTGPEEAGWTAPLETGLREALAASAVKDHRLTPEASLGGM